MDLETKMINMIGVYSCMHEMGLPPYKCPICNAEGLKIGGGSSGFLPGSSNNIYKDEEIDPGYSLQERYDFSKHDDTEVHLNQSIHDMNQEDKFGGYKEIIDGGVSRKIKDKYHDGYKGLGPAHSKKLFEK